MPKHPTSRSEPEGFGRSNGRLGEFVTGLEKITKKDRPVAQVPDTEYNRKKFIEDLLNLNDWSVDRLAVQPGESYFEFWFLVSSYFPFIVGTIGPISNLTNIVSLIDSWRTDMTTGENVKDFPWLLKLNGISVMFALISNASLLMNTRNKMRYTISQTISIAGWFIAATLLMVLVIVGYCIYFVDTNYEPSQGFWFALITVVLYYACFVILVLNELGFLLKKYPPVFNIDDKQKNLMVLVIILMIFLICGSAVFASLMDTSFANALYFVVVTILTVGLGDFVPYNPGGKILILIYSVIGLLLLALIISTIRELVISSAASTFEWHRMEKHRKKKLNKLTKESVKLSDEDSFDLMMDVMKRGKLHEGKKSLILVLTMFIAFWLVGAAVFFFAESWDYGTACYFCFLCLVTIGYGVPSPTSSAGKAFFVVWGLAAVPLMTMLISNMSDILFASLKDTNNYSILDPILNLCSHVMAITSHILRRTHVAIHDAVYGSKEDADQDIPSSNDDDDDGDVGSDASFERWILESEMPAYLGSPLSELPSGASGAAKDLRSVLEMVKELQKVMIISIENPTKRFTYEEWVNMFTYIGHPHVEAENYWLSDESPFKFPLKQCHFFEFKYIVAMEKILKKLLKEAELEYVDEQLNRYISSRSSSRQAKRRLRPSQ